MSDKESEHEGSDVKLDQLSEAAKRAMFLTLQEQFSSLVKQFVNPQRMYCRMKNVLGCKPIPRGEVDYVTQQLLASQMITDMYWKVVDKKQHILYSLYIPVLDIVIKSKCMVYSFKVNEVAQSSVYTRWS